MFSVIISTRNRPEQLRNIISDLLVQDTAQVFEIIVIDQSSKEDPLSGILYNKPPVRYIKTNSTGLSVGRNIGLEYSSGEVLCLMDDDARVTKTYLSDIQGVFSEDESIGIGCGLIKNIEDDELYSRHMRGAENRIITLWSFDRCLSSSMFFKRNVYEKIGGFDEIFGVGAWFGGSEESDFVIRALMCDIRVYGVDKPVVGHPKFLFGAHEKQNLFKKGFSYGLGRGALFKKHIKSKPLWSLIQLARAVVLSFLSIVKNMMWFNLNGAFWGCGQLKGRIIGFITYKNNANS